jgi:hypothetical protein
MQTFLMLEHSLHLCPSVLRFKLGLTWLHTCPKAPKVLRVRLLFASMKCIAILLKVTRKPLMEAQFACDIRGGMDNTKNVVSGKSQSDLIITN